MRGEHWFEYAGDMPLSNASGVGGRGEEEEFTSFQPHQAD